MEDKGSRDEAGALPLRTEEVTIRTKRAESLSRLFPLALTAGWVGLR